jgi:hypothetical protein
MNHEAMESAVCAASDLAARIDAELAQANAHLHAAEMRFRAASAQAISSHRPIPFAVRRQRIECRQQIFLLQQVLAGMPTTGEVDHAESA